MPDSDLSRDTWAETAPGVAEIWDLYFEARPDLVEKGPYRAMKCMSTYIVGMEKHWWVRLGRFLHLI